MSETNEEVKVTKDEKTGDTIMKKPTRYKRLDPTTQELAAEEEPPPPHEANKAIMAIKIKILLNIEKLPIRFIYIL